MAMGDAYVIVYSITDKGSFEKASELRVQLRRARQTDDVPIILVGNKSDLVRSREVSVDGKQASGQEREGDPGWAVGQLVLAQLESLGIISG
jgi:GTPase SAR1 family protein